MYLRILTFQKDESLMAEDSAPQYVVPRATPEQIQYNFNNSNTNGSFTMADTNSFLSA